MLIQNFGMMQTCNYYYVQCKYRCCSFNDNYIVLYPGEFENSEGHKKHIKIIDDNYFGGKKAICLTPCKKNEFKPMDCKSYPYFPKINAAGKVEIIKGLKCPLKEEELVDHKEKFLKIWNDLIKDKVIFEWLKNVELVGYDVVEQNNFAHL